MNLNLSMSSRKPRGELAAIFARLPAKNQPAPSGASRGCISQPRILLMIFLPASRHFPASAPRAHRRTTSPCWSLISDFQAVGSQIR